MTDQPKCQYNIRYLHLCNESDRVSIMQKTGVDPYGIEAMLPKMTGYCLHLEAIPCKMANIIKQEMLSVGGDAAVSRNSVSCSIDKTDAVVIGSEKQIMRFADKIDEQPFGLSGIAREVKALIRNLSIEHYNLKTGKRDIRIGDRTLIMGILNVTPDSFSDGGRFKSAQEAVESGLQMIEDGADMIDIGGESSRPGSDPVTVKEEMARVIPVIRGLAKKTSVPISVDTTKSEVAEEAVDQGAEIINDISGLRFDARMAEVIAGKKSALIIMHMKGTPKDMQAGNISYSSVTGDILSFMKKQMEYAESSGIQQECIMIDPGIGFGKTPGDNLKILKNLREFRALGRPIVMGVSRKSFIGHLTGGLPSERIEGTAAAVSASVMNGSRVIRVHDVKFMKKVTSVADAILRA
jgi:dihydropteroate synthase